MPTIHDVARMAGVHRSTVSRVLTGQGSVSEKSRKKVLEAARKMNFHLNTVASALKSQRKSAIGLLSFWHCSPNPSEAFYQQTLTGIINEITRSKYNLLLNNIEGTLDPDNEKMKFCYESHLGGILLMAPLVKEEAAFDFLSGLNIPVLFLLYKPRDYRYSFLDLDNRQGAHLAVDHLVQLGHQRIAYIGGELDYSSNARDRYKGYQGSLAKAGLKEDPQLVRNGYFWSGHGEESMKAFLTLPAAQRPTAVFAATDTIAYGVMKAADSAGLKVPEDISVVGFDDYETSALTHPPLTTIRQPFYTIGQQSVQLLESLMKEPKDKPKHQFVSPELIVRGSTAPPNVQTT
jgi:LacI family transcriptional regulator